MWHTPFYNNNLNHDKDSSRTIFIEELSGTIIICQDYLHSEDLIESVGCSPTYGPELFIFSINKYVTMARKPWYRRELQLIQYCPIAHLV